MTVYHPLLVKQLSIAGIDISKGILSSAEVEELLGFVNRFYGQILPMDKQHHANMTTSDPDFGDEAVLILDTNWRICQQNRAASQLLGLDLTQEPGLSFNNLFTLLNSRQHPLNLERLIDYFDCGQVYVCRAGVLWHHKHPDKSAFVRFSLTPVMGAQKPEVFILRLQNISDTIEKRAKEVKAQLEDEVMNQKRYYLLSQVRKRLMANIHNGLLAHQLKQFSTELLDDKLCQFSTLQSLQNNSQILRQVRDDYHDINELLPTEYIFDLHTMSQKITRDLQKITGLTLVTADFSHAKNLKTDPLSVLLMIYDLASLLIVNCKALTKLHLEISVKHNKTEQHQQELYIALKCETCFDVKLTQKTIQEIDNLVNSKHQHHLDMQHKHNQIHIQIKRYYNQNKELRRINQPKHELRILGIGLNPNEQQALARFKQKRIESLDFCEDFIEAIPLFKQQRLRQREYHLVFTGTKDYQTLKLAFYDEIMSYIHDDFISLVMILNQEDNLETTVDIPVMTIDKQNFFKSLPALFDDVLIKQFCRHSQLLPAIPKPPPAPLHFILHDYEGSAEPLYKRILNKLGIQLINPEIALDMQDNDNCIHGIMLNIEDPSIDMLGEVHLLKQKYANKPLILMSPALSEQEYLLWIKAGIDEVLFKPFTLAEMVNILYKCSLGVEKICPSPE